MKYATSIIFTVLIGLLSQSSLKAQNIDTDRMNRDMRISEKILGELFTPHAAKNKKVGILSFGGNSDEINGTYLPGYGVLFVIQGQIPALPMVISVNHVRQDSSFYFKLNSNGRNEKTPITKETIIDQIRHFLQTYAPTIGQLKSDDRITVVYQSISGVNDFTFVNLKSDTKQNSDRKRLPAEISVSVKKEDLHALNSGSISKKQFDNRLQVSTSEKVNSKHNDIRVMATILKAAFQGDNQKFSISRSVHHLYVRGLGALFFANASYKTHSFSRAFLEISNSFKKLTKSDTSGGFIQISKTPKSKAEILKFKKQKKEDFKQFLNQLKQTLVDYGRTINSISKNESIFLLVDITDTGIFPNDIKLQINESTLQAYNHGNISRQQAIDKVIVRKS